MKEINIKVATGDAIDRMRRLVLTPTQVFREISLLPDVKGPRMIMGGIAFLLAFQFTILLNKMGAAFDFFPIFNPGATNYLRFFVWINSLVGWLFIIIASTISMFLMCWIFWRVGSRLLLIASKMVGGGSLKISQIRSMMGYSAIGVLACEVISTLLILFAPSDEMDIGQLSQYFDAHGDSFVWILKMGLMIIGWLYFGYLGVIAYTKVGNMPMPLAVAAIGLPLLFFISVFYI